MAFNKFTFETLESCLVYEEWMVCCPLHLVGDGHLSCCAIRSVAKTYLRVTEEGNSTLSSLFLNSTALFFLLLWGKKKFISGRIQMYPG